VADGRGAGRVVIHSGALMGRTRREALDIALRSLKEVTAACDGAGFGHITLCPETMGKINQLGDLDEVLELCTLDERLLPCVDFGHLYARSLGADDGAEAVERMLTRMEGALGPDRAGRFHSHFSHIEFTPNGGEKCHRTFDDDGGYGPNWAPLAAEIVRRGWSPTFICESAGTQAEDALTMKRTYQPLLPGQGEDFPGLVRRGGEGLFHQDVLARVENLFGVGHVEPVRGVDHHQINLGVAEHPVKVAGKGQLRVEGLIFAELGDILLPAEDVFYPDVLPALHVGDVVLPDADAKADI